MKRVAVVLAIVIASACAARQPVRSSIVPLRVTVAESLRHVGSKQFILRHSADTEQHVFAESGSTGEVKRLVWIQYERYLPKVEGEYDYGREQVVTLGGTEFVAHTREYNEPPDAGSDREHVYSQLAAKGLRLTTPATRVRLVHVPPGDRRSELMIIYAEPGSIPPEQLLSRALATVKISSP